MSQSGDVIHLVLRGELPFALGVAGLLAFPISFLLLRLYRRAVLKSMDRPAGQGESLPPGGEASAASALKPTGLLRITSLEGQDHVLTPEAQARYDRAVRAPWQAAAVYSLGGAGFAGILAAAFIFAGKLGFLPSKFVMLVWTFGWPLLITFGLVGGSRARAKLLMVLAYFGSYIIIGCIILTLHPGFSLKDLFTLWVVVNVIPTVLALAYLTRQVRAVGPMILTFLVLAFSGAVVLVGFVGRHEALLRKIVHFTSFLGGTGIFVGLHLVGFALLGGLGWILVQWIRAGYERKRISDQTLTLDSLWLLFCIVYAIIFFTPSGALWGLTGIAAFLIYKVTAGLGFAVTKGSGPGQGVRLLLLRVFALGKRSEKLFEAFGTHWRYLGPIQMIAGPDLATTTIAPHEFLQFLTGKLARRFIGDRETLERRLSEMDVKPDRDWRFRVNDFFCFADTWKMVLDRLVLESDAVLMDLRSFSRERAGCIFEITELINTVSLDRAVFMVDATTDEPFLRQTIQQAWNDLRPSSPNYASPDPQLRLFHYAGPQSQDHLLRAVCAAAIS